MSKLTTYLIILFFIFSTYLSAEDLRPDGVYLGFNYNLLFEDASFIQLPGIPNCCEEFNGGKGIGYDIFAAYSRNILPGLFAGARLSVLMSSTNFTSTEDTYVIYEDESVPGKFEHLLNINSAIMFIEPNLNYRVWKNLNIGIGFPIGTFLDKNFSQKEKIIDPIDAGTFADSMGNNTEQRVRNQFSGSLPLKNRILYMFDLNISYDLPLDNDGSFFLRPEISLNFGLSDLLSELNWKRDYISFGLSFHYKFGSEDYGILDSIYLPDKSFIPSNEIKLSKLPAENKTIDLRKIKVSEQTSFADQREEFFFVYDTINITKKEIRKEIVYRSDTIVEFYGGNSGFDNSIDDNISQAVIKIEEFNAVFSIPLLNIVFFDEGSAEIPDRYLNSDEQSPIAKVYYNIFSIIGSRMNKLPEAKLTLSCNGSLVSKDVEIVQKRAENIRDHLLKQYGISPHKIEIKIDHIKNVQNLNNRIVDDYDLIEISSNDPNILKPVSVHDTLFQFTPSIASFYPLESEEVSDVWTFSIVNNQILYKKVIGSEYLPKSIRWNLENSELSDYESNQPFVYEWLSKNNGGELNLGSGSFVFKFDGDSIQRQNRELRTERIYYIQFDYNSYRLDDNALKIIGEAKSRINAESEISILGYSDNSGDPAYNLKLSKLRAETVSKELGSYNAIVRGLGINTKALNEKYPESQYYSRIVEIRIR